MLHVDLWARGGFVGFGSYYDCGVLIRVVLEGVVFSIRESLHLLDGFVGVLVTVWVLGGGARSDTWLEILVVVFDFLFEVCYVQEGVVYGVALFGGVVVGLWMDVFEVVEQCVRVTCTIELNCDWVERYAVLCLCYDVLYFGLHGIQHVAD